MFNYTGKRLDPTSHVPCRSKEVNIAGIVHIKIQNRITKSEIKHTLHFGVHSSLFLCPILVSDIAKEINLQGKSQGKSDHLIAKTCWRQCYWDLKLTSSCGLALDSVCPDNFWWTTSCVVVFFCFLGFFSMPGSLNYNSLRTEKCIPQNMVVISYWMLSVTVASFITATCYISHKTRRQTLKKSACPLDTSPYLNIHEIFT